jgi:hypothetical protein
MLKVESRNAPKTATANIGFIAMIVRLISHFLRRLATPACGGFMKTAADTSG